MASKLMIPFTTQLQAVVSIVLKMFQTSQKEEDKIDNKIKGYRGKNFSIKSITS